MPIEAALLDGAPVPLGYCPKCYAAPFRPFMRGQVQRGMLRVWLARLLSNREEGYCALICRECKEIVGYE